MSHDLPPLPPLLTRKEKVVIAIVFVVLILAALWLIDVLSNTAVEFTACMDETDGGTWACLNR